MSSVLSYVSSRDGLQPSLEPVDWSLIDRSISMCLMLSPLTQEYEPGDKAIPIPWIQPLKCISMPNVWYLRRHLVRLCNIKKNISLGLQMQLIRIGHQKWVKSTLRLPQTLINTVYSFTLKRSSNIVSWKVMIVPKSKFQENIFFSLNVKNYQFIFRHAFVYSYEAGLQRYNCSLHYAQLRPFPILFKWFILFIYIF